MKNITLVTLKKVNEVNTSLEHRWRHNCYDPMVSAKEASFIGMVLLITALGIVGLELWQKYPIFPIATLIVTVFSGSLIFLLGNTTFGTKLEELCRIFGCNFGQLAVMDTEVMADMAKDILDDMVYDLVCKENKYKVGHPITVVARMEYERVLAVFLDLGIHDGKIGVVFARANGRFALEHKQQVAAPV